MAANRARHIGLPRGGPALLGGLVVCGVCGRRMCVSYNDDGREALYACNQMAPTYGAPPWLERIRSFTHRAFVGGLTLIPWATSRDATVASKRVAVQGGGHRRWHNLKLSKNSSQQKAMHSRDSESFVPHRALKQG
jgi:hypothetical protein